ncbi:MAG: DNA helicase RecQ [Candidatus Lindowbacteria bacterium]|nr:DNA helicase RecQ [Candidatus Lindowbacteria bacterium]
MAQQAIDILKETFGFESFRGDQAEVIDMVVNGGNGLVLMPTGGGKSLCYQIPSIIRDGVGIVVSPLISLMQDQVSALKLNGVKAAFLNSTLEREEAYEIECAMKKGKLDLVYVAPERALRPGFLNLLKQTPLAMFAIDEAHCVSQWGHDFRPEYIQLSVLQEKFPDVPRLALTATADDITRKEIREKLFLEDAKMFVASFDRPNIRYRIALKSSPHPQLLRFLKSEHPKSSGIIYRLSRKMTESTTEFLNRNGFTALTYHAGMDAADRAENQRRFLEEEGIIVVATVAFGMGIDKPDVRFVAHLDLPKSVESYYQETGRAGRDGEKADAWMVYGLGDVVLLRKMLGDSTAGAGHKRVEGQRLTSLMGLCETTKCRRQVLLKYFGEELAEPCGNCDTCLEEVETFDGTVAAQKALSCVFRTGQKFGVGHLIDVLHGEETEKVLSFEHDQVSTFGIGLDISSNEWKSIYRQLTAAGLLDVDVSGYGGLKLTPESKPVLKGNQEVFFRKDPVATKTARTKAKKSKTTWTSDDPIVTELWEELRAVRAEVAKEHNIPPFYIFHDATLKEMIEIFPQTTDAMLEIGGVGESKLARYGDRFLSVLQNHKETHGKPELNITA